LLQSLHHYIFIIIVIVIIIVMILLKVSVMFIAIFIHISNDHYQILVKIYIPCVHFLYDK